MKQAVRLGLLTGVLAGLILSCTRSPVSIAGTILERNSDPRKRSPIAGVAVTATMGSTTTSGQTDALGYFSLKLSGWIRRGQPLQVNFQHPGYQPLWLSTTFTDKLLVEEMTPISANAPPPKEGPKVSVANVKIRYSMKSKDAENVGSAVKAFEVENKGNVPCNGHMPCSPDGKWKASIGSMSLNAGEGNEFRNVRLSCIAGPCPFTKIASDQYSRGGNTITASVLDWSDTATYLLEAEVYHPMFNDVVRNSYPVVFGHTLNFSVPETGEGVSIEAEVNGEAIVFPLGPTLCLSWANCTSTTDKDHSKSYRCELKDGFAFK